MTTYAGREWSRAELTMHVGNLRQLAGITPIEHGDGRARGTRSFNVYTGSGLVFDVLADRSLDINGVWYRGQSLAWSSANGAVHPAYYEAQGLGWLRSFPGGLMTTCGLDQFGSPTQDNGETFGIHGRVNHLPAEQLAYRTYWEGDDYHLEITGKVRQARLFGENLVLERTICTTLGSNSITIVDNVTNEGFSPQPHMILYHCNLGFPLLSADAELSINATETIPRDNTARLGIKDWMHFQPPTANYAEQVFRHVIAPDADGTATVKLNNPTTQLSLTITYSYETLPHLFQWKQMGQGAYVLGIEPANSSAIEGRAVARQLDDLPYLQPGENRQYTLQFAVEETAQ